MALEDYIPNFFGGGMPQYMPGLLGEQEAQALQKRANVQGLLGAALSLAQGMNTPRTTAAQNVLGALAGGFAAGQGAYQGATQNYMMQQKIAESMLERQKAQMQIEAQKEFAKRYPELMGIYGANPTEAAKAAAEREAFAPIAEIYNNVGGGSQPDMRPTQSVPQDSSMPQSEQSASNADGSYEKPRQLGNVNVIGDKIPPEVSNLMRQKEQLLAVNQRLYGIRGGNAEIDKNLKIIEGIDKQIGSYTTANYDFAAIKSTLPQEFQGAAQQLEALAYSGSISPKDLASEVTKLQKEARDYAQKQADFTNNVRRISAEMFPGKPLEQLQQQELAQLNKRILDEDLLSGKARAANVNVAVTGEKKMAEKRAEGAVKAEEGAFNAMSVAGDVRAIVEILRPYRGGPIQSFQAQLGAYFPGTPAEKLASANQVAESIRQRIAPTIRVEGSGATSDFEARSYLNAIPNLMNTAEGRELMAVYAEKLANRAAAAADIRANMVSQGNFSVKRFQEEMKRAGLTQVFTPEDLKILRGETAVKSSPALPSGVTVRKVK